MICEVEPTPQLLAIDAWQLSFRQIKMVRGEDCPCCSERKFDFLQARETAWVTSLCGRNTIQITPAHPATLALEKLAESLATVGTTSFNGFLLELTVDGYEMVVFPDGRALVKGTTDEALARTLYAKYLGS